jgi:tetratricopeptide (TPR) repeat protein
LLILLCLFLLGAPSFIQAQTTPTGDPSIPPEFAAADPEIRELLGAGDNSCKAIDPGRWKVKLEKALQISESRDLLGDKALVEALLASVSATQGDLDSALILLRKALQDSLEAKKEVLEADVLVSLAAQAQLNGNIQEAISLTTRAVSLSEKTGNLYGKARALGELGRLKLILGKHEEASQAIEEALTIDRLNGYKFEVLHLIYRGYFLGLIGNDSKAFDTMQQARSKALIVEDYLNFLSAENSYAFALARKGKAEEAIRQMEMLRSGKVDEFVNDPRQKSCFAASLELPILRMILLEGLTNVLEAANQKEKEIGVWRELFSLSEKQKTIAAQAEARQKIADLENQLKHPEEALKNYEAAAILYKRLGNQALLSQVQLEQAVLLVNLGRGKEAIPILQELITYTKQHNLRQLEFRAYFMVATVFQRGGELQKARDALEAAISIIHPGPFDDEIDNQMVHLAYLSLSDIYQALSNAPKELVSIDRAFFVSVHLKDEKSQQEEVLYLDQRLKDLKIRSLVEERQKTNQLNEALTFSYVLYLRDGHPENAAENPNWQRIIDLPFQIVQKPGGAAELAAIWKDLGPILGIERLPLLDALARYYISSGNPRSAESYAAEAEKFVDTLKGDQDVLRTQSTCVLALAYSQQAKNVDAEQ